MDNGENDPIILSLKFFWSTIMFGIPGLFIFFFLNLFLPLEIAVVGAVFLVALIWTKIKGKMRK